MEREVTYLGRFLSQLEKPFFGKPILPFLLHFWRQLGAGAILLECRLSFQHALERHLRELLPEEKKVSLIKTDHGSRYMHVLQLLVQLAHLDGRIFPYPVPLNDVTAIDNKEAYSRSGSISKKKRSK